MRRNYRSLVGVLAEDSLRQLKSDIAFLGHERRRPRAGRVGHHDGRGADQAADDRAAPTSVVLIADAAKFAMTGMVRVCGPESIDHIVTDAPLPASARSAVDAAGIEVTIA